MLRVDFVTLFPEMVLGAMSHSIMGRAVDAGLVEFRASNPRDFATDKHRSVDDTSYGGGPGMVMMAPLVAAALGALEPSADAAVVLCDAAGERFDQTAARSLAASPQVVFLCGHYEGVDERVRTKLATHCYSVGDFVMTGGEIPALAMADAVVRLLPGAIGDPESHQDDSFEGGLLGFPLYTRPESFMGEGVPDVLRSGNHGEVAKWRRLQQLLRTREYRPDLFCQARLSTTDIGLIGPI
jgi:tRNA (guanine37-N1)-methyltransferase